MIYLIATSLCIVGGIATDLLLMRAKSRPEPVRHIQPILFR